MGIVLVPEKIAQYLLLSVLIAVRKLPYRLNPVGTDQSIVEIVTRRGVIATKIASLGALSEVYSESKEGLKIAPLFYFCFNLLPT